MLSNPKSSKAAKTAAGSVVSYCLGITDIEFVQAEGVAMGEDAVASAIAKGRASIEALAA